LRSGTSVGANYRAACRAKSLPDFVAKLAIAEEECDESLYWIELLMEGKLAAGSIATPLWKEGNELLAILVASIRTSRSKISSTRAAHRRNPISAPPAETSSIQNSKSKIQNR
jgi:four helix bundle protein